MNIMSFSKMGYSRECPFVLCFMSGITHLYNAIINLKAVLQRRNCI
ncbi:MAG: hypothetical protein K0R80_1624 [Clostridia bacterium]|jgi:hypothetical protein|nr:hypothetical protein [Clostridia bacterium]